MTQLGAISFLLFYCGTNFLETAVALDAQFYQLIKEIKNLGRFRRLTIYIYMTKKKKKSKKKVVPLIIRWMHGKNVLGIISVVFAHFLINKGLKVQDHSRIKNTYGNIPRVQEVEAHILLTISLTNYFAA